MNGRRPEEPESSRIGREYFVSIVVALVIFGSIAAILLFIFYSGPYRDDIYHHKYAVDITAIDNVSYEVIVPVPMNAEHEIPQDFIDDVEVTNGTALIEVLATDKGLGLRILGVGNATISWEEVVDSPSAEIIGNLTMTTGAEGWNSPEPCISWYYSNRADIDISFYYGSMHSYMSSWNYPSGGGPTYSVHFASYIQGWREVQVDYGWLVIN